MLVGSANFKLTKGMVMRNHRRIVRAVSLTAALLFLGSGKEILASGNDDDACTDCHAKTSAGIVRQWRHSTHAGSDVKCLACHGAEQRTTLRLRIRRS